VKAFDHVCPTSVDEAVRILSMHRGEAKVLAGGTDLLNLMRDGETSPKLIVSLKNIGEFRDITKHDGGVSIGAFCTLENCARSELIRGKYPILYDAFRQMGSLQVRSRGTIGGNICNGSPAADTAAPLMVLGAEIIIQGPQGERRKPVVDFFTGPGETILEPDEILTTITLPTIKGKGAGLYVKLGRRNAMEIAIVGVAVYVILEPSNKKISDIRIAISSAAPKPLRVYEAESIFKGRLPEPQLIEEAASIVSRASNPITDVRASKEYRKEMLRVLTIRAITDIVSGL
jgi:carbon-monoxide dehydrogenase medium subunit